MTRPKITGGDWLTWGPSDCSICSNVEPGPVIVANTETDPSLSYAEYRANARFLAASKQMAEALEKIAEGWEQATPDHHAPLTRSDMKALAKSALTAAGYEL